MTYQMLMAIGVAISIRTFAFTPVRQTARLQLQLNLCLRKDESNNA